MSAACPRFGFSVDVSVHEHIAPARRQELRAEFLRLLDMSGMTCSGASGASWRFMLSREAGQATNDDRDLVGRWAGERPEIASCRVGDLVDLRE